MLKEIVVYEWQNKKQTGEESAYVLKNKQTKKKNNNIGGMKNNDTYVIHVLGLFFRSLQWLLLASYNTYNGHFDFFFLQYWKKNKLNATIQRWSNVVLVLCVVLHFKNDNHNTDTLY